MKIDKLGIYQERNGDFITISSIEDYIDENTEGLLGVMVDITYHNSKSLYGIIKRSYTLDGYYFGNKSRQGVDVVRYFSIEEYPELYI